MKFEEFDRYSENMLMAQYDISEIITHELMKGEIREDFLISTLESCSEPKPSFVKGTLSDGIKDAGQLDILLCRPHAHLRKLGTQCCVRKEDALCVIEVKGNCTGTDLKKASKKAIVIRDLQGQRAPLYGIVCYRVALELKTIMKRFGFSFDGENKTYFDNATIPNELEENWLSIKYPDLDFFVSLEDEKKLFLRKYEMQPGKFRFVRSVREPIIQELFSMIQSLWVTSNQGPAI
ncbi:DUF6602 domain-containing protein [Chlorobium phaeobacteroides]|uniref:DUF6602 domain-containing protein n=1 Tax=Chlorobium phaeobacteroides (strain DSM 266 / SMG 266 / 2430) TaxID=290317 RepID=A1BEW5_CHLPD|nr:DUF6602 domain-containing protein [Chlorobium phaeobacteroides]ABL64942.1 hypothetical protein Cpha266_0894 [Chlorobium phaeobacteroides DSM 266]